MNGRLIGVWIAAVFASAIFMGNAFAASDLVTKLQTDLYAGQTADAASVARAWLAEAPDDAQARFALGAVEFLQAVEHLGQGLHRYGLRSNYSGMLLGLGGLPFLRLPVPDNDNPEKVTYEALRGILTDFVRDLGTADATLGMVNSSEIDLPLNIGLIHLDLNGDGKSTDDEALWHMFAAVANANWLDEAAGKELLVDFDSSDVPWLRAYSQLLMAISEFPLAYDWHEAFETTFHGVFPHAELPMSEALKNEQKMLAELEKLGPPPEPEVFVEKNEEWSKTPEGQKYDRYYDLRQRLEYGGIADLIAFVHLNHWPVVEPDRLSHVLDHLQAMVRFSRENWTRILAETDDRKEWIPNLKQTGALPRMRVTEDQVQGWQQFLDEFEAILEGKKLIPHWRFDKGINLRRFFLEPRTLDVVLMIQGSAAVPYLEEGDLSSQATWIATMRLFGGDFFRYFIWFN